jgi:DNA-binding NarL/FixJ family response regulator
MEALRVTLEQEPDIEVVGTAGDRQAIAHVEQYSPHVVILTDPLSGDEGAQAAALIRERSPQTKIVFLWDDERPRGLAAALRAGAAGFLTARSALDELIEATRAVHRGEVLVPPGMLRSLLDDLMGLHSQQEGTGLLRRLTRREKQVLALLSVGSKNEAIAEALVISPHTARTHVRSIFSKLGVHSRVEAAELAQRGEAAGLPTLPLQVGS